jgi:hypothetical protein
MCDTLWGHSSKNASKKFEIWVWVQKKKDLELLAHSRKVLGLNKHTQGKWKVRRILRNVKS